MTRKVTSNTLALIIILNAVGFTFLVSRIVAYLIISGFLPIFLFASFNGFRLHHFVYGNIIITITSFLAIGLGIKKHRNLFALFYGIGLGMVLDEFMLWVGDIKQLTSNVLWIPYSLMAIASVAIILATIIMYKLYATPRR